MEVKILTVMFTDMEGFTARSGEQSREGLVELLTRHKALVVPHIEKHRGKIIKTIGDAFLAVFESATDAVYSAKEIQNSLRSHNKDAEKGKAINLKIGLNTGEVTLLDGDVFGEAVNIASRVQNLAPPGGIFFTEATYLAMNKNEIPWIKMGETSVKGIVEAINLFRVPQPWEKQDSRVSGGQKSAPSSRRALAATFDFFLIVMLIVLLGVADSADEFESKRNSALEAAYQRAEKSTAFRRDILDDLLNSPTNPVAQKWGGELMLLKKEKENFDEDDSNSVLTMRIILFFFFVLYNFLTVWLFSRTIGKALFRLKVVRQDGKALGFKCAFVRAISSVLSVIPIGIGYVWGLFSKSGRTWHDLISETRVIRS